VFGFTSTRTCKYFWNYFFILIFNLKENNLCEEELEKSVLKEFGRCLEQIIESATSCLPFQIQQQSSLLIPKHKIETNDLEGKNNF